MLSQTKHFKDSSEFFSLLVIGYIHVHVFKNDLLPKDLTLSTACLRFARVELDAVFLQGKWIRFLWLDSLTAGNCELRREEGNNDSLLHTKDAFQSKVLKRNIYWNYYVSFNCYVETLNRLGFHVNAQATTMGHCGFQTVAYRRLFSIHFLQTIYFIAFHR